MDFFQSQDIAKRNTGRLILLFAIAVLSLIVITNVLVMAVFGFFGSSTGESQNLPVFDWNVFLLVSAVVLSVVVSGSLYKMAALAGGGARVAEMLDGRLLLPSTPDFHEKRVLNVVEEMALASGTPVPPVYLLEEQGINAFAAGYAPDDAVIGITRGAIESLTRDELQGVIAHEFSHILHGDMRINIRLIAILHGILVLGIIGYHLMRSGSHARRSKDSGGLVFLGLGLLVIGYVGTFFGNLIKAAVSRQREYLADASSVQFTRNPEGIGHALIRIANHSERSYLTNPNRMEISHALFEEGGRVLLSGLMATHPPLEDRIRAVLPNWDGRYDLLPDPDSFSEPQTPKSEVAEQQTGITGSVGGATGLLIADALIAQTGNPSRESVSQAQQILLQIPQSLQSAAREPAGARAVMYLLLLDGDGSVRSGQLDVLRAGADFGVYEEVQKLGDVAGKLSPEIRLPLINIALGTLRQLSKEQYMRLRDNMDKLIAYDKKVSLFEWSLQTIVARHLDAVFIKKQPRPLGRAKLEEMPRESALLLSALSYAGGGTDTANRRAFQLGSEKLGIGELVMVSRSDISFKGLNAALERLNGINPLQKPALLKACAASIIADQVVSAAELELFRAVADTLDCPMPPINYADS
ncbi:MAG: hypothetical protein RLZZ385_486 [Pseudomonadota bacterium]|jgi:Zn-dependent protease with chaperone function